MPKLNDLFPYFGGVSALAFDKSTATYYAGCEEIWLGDAEWSPRFYEISLSFDGKTDNGTATVLRRVDVGHDEGLKIEGADVSPRGELWLCSEMNSGNQARLMPPSSFLQRSFGFKDVGIIQDGQPQDWPSRVVRVNKTSGAVLSSAQLPAYVPWDGEWSWNAQQCHGTRHLAGLQAFAFTSDGRLAITAGQSALYQDGGAPTSYSGSAVRVFYYDVDSPDTSSSASSSLRYSHAMRYRTSRIIGTSALALANQHSALVGLVPLTNDGTVLCSLLVCATAWPAGLPRTDPLRSRAEPEQLTFLYHHPPRCFLYLSSRKYLTPPSPTFAARPRCSSSYDITNHAQPQSQPHAPTPAGGGACPIPHPQLQLYLLPPSPSLFTQINSDPLSLTPTSTLTTTPTLTFAFALTVTTGSYERPFDRCVPLAARGRMR